MKTEYKPSGYTVNYYAGLSGFTQQLQDPEIQRKLDKAPLRSRGSNLQSVFHRALGNKTIIITISITTTL